MSRKTELSHIEAKNKRNKSTHFISQADIADLKFQEAMINAEAKRKGVEVGDVTASRWCGCGCIVLHPSYKSKTRAPKYAWKCKFGPIEAMIETEKSHFKVAACHAKSKKAKTLLMTQRDATNHLNKTGHVVEIYEV